LGGPKPLNNGGWDVDGKPLEETSEYNSGLWLFLDRKNITHFFKPNFLPPYDTREKRELILDFLSEEWDQDELVWKPVAPALKKKYAELESPVEEKKVELV